MVNMNLRELRRLWPFSAATSRRAAMVATAATLLTGLAAGPASAAHGHGTDAQPPVAQVNTTMAKPGLGKLDKPARPSAAQLTPQGVPDAQQTFTPTAEQMRNAQIIVETGQQMKLPPRAWVIAVATSLQESALKNLGHLGENNDHDSQGLFQQRPSSGWGTPKQITNPTYASTKFYEGLKQVSGWTDMPLTAAAQTVQGSAFPDHYAKWEKQAADLVLATYGAGPHAKVADHHR